MENTLKGAAMAVPKQKEVWKRIKGFPAYEVSNRGNVRSGGRIMPAKPDVFTNRRSVILHNGKLKKNLRIARLVALHFIPNPENKPCVNHKDGNAANDCAENLEWVTHSENMQHAYQNGLIRKPKRRLTDSDKLAMRELKEAGAKTRNLARIWGCSLNTVLNNTARVV